MASGEMFVSADPYEQWNRAGAEVGQPAAHKIKSRGPMDIEPVELLLTQRAEMLSHAVTAGRKTESEAVRELSVYDNRVMVEHNAGNLRPLINEAIREREQAGPSRPLTHEQTERQQQFQQRLLAGVGVDWKPPEPQIERER